MLRKLIPLCALILAALACTLPIKSDPQPTQPVQAPIIITIDPNGRPTNTPFQPIPPTPTKTTSPRSSPTVANVNKTIPPPTPTQRPPAIAATNTVVSPRPQGRMNILVLGSDRRSTRDFRTDVIVLISINLSSGTVSMISFPRDLYLKIPGYGTDRINIAMEMGGFKMLADTFDTNFGVRPSFYALVDFQGFVKIIDALGGIDVKVAQTLTDKCDLPQARAGYCTVKAGSVQMDGKTALWYARSRHSTSDFNRIQRAQEVLVAIFQRFMSINSITKAPELYSAYRSSFETNLGLLDMVPLIKVAPSLTDSSKIKHFVIGPEYVSNYTVPSTGAMVLLPNLPAIRELVKQAINQ